MKCTTTMTLLKIKSAQPVFDTFCKPVPALCRRLQLEHHQRVRLLKAVYGLVNAPRRWYHGVATDLRNMGGEESLMEPCLWIFRNENGVIHALCLVHVDDFKLACSIYSYGQYVFDGINNLYGWGTWESRVGADLRSVSQNTRNLPSHRRRDRKSQITPIELSQLRALNGQLIWLVMQCLPQWLAPLSLLMGQTPQVTVDTIYEVNRLARKATVWAKIPLKVHAHRSLVGVT